MCLAETLSKLCLDGRSPDKVSFVLPVAQMAPLSVNHPVDQHGYLQGPVDGVGTRTDMGAERAVRVG